MKSVHIVTYLSTNSKILRKAACILVDNVKLMNLTGQMTMANKT